jgi:hypothetical protein
MHHLGITRAAQMKSEVLLHLRAARPARASRSSRVACPALIVVQPVASTKRPDAVRVVCKLTPATTFVLGRIASGWAVCADSLLVNAAAMLANANHDDTSLNRGVEESLLPIQAGKRPGWSLER